MTVRRALVVMAAGLVVVLTLPGSVLRWLSLSAVAAISGILTLIVLSWGSLLWAEWRLERIERRRARWTVDDDRRLREWADG